VCTWLEALSCVHVSCRTFKCARGLKQHVHMVHRLCVVSMSASKCRVICPECASIFPSHQKLDEHLQRSHGTVLSAAGSNAQTNTTVVVDGSLRQANGKAAHSKEGVASSQDHEGAVKGASRNCCSCQESVQGNARHFSEMGLPAHSASDQATGCQNSSLEEAKHHGLALSEKLGRQNVEGTRTATTGKFPDTQRQIDHLQETHGSHIPRDAAEDTRGDGSTRECSVCGITFASVSAFTEHLSWFVPQEWEVLCFACGRRFPDGRALEQHTRSGACKSR
jgi:hypothetical protein